MNRLCKLAASALARSLALGAWLAISACGPSPSPPAELSDAAARPQTAGSSVEGMLAVQMVDSGVAADGTSRGINLFSVDDGTTVYQLIKTEGTKYTNLVVDEQSVAWQLGRRYRFVGPVFCSLPAEYAKTPKLMPGEKPLAFVVASEVILLDEQPSGP